MFDYSGVLSAGLVRDGAMKDIYEYAYTRYSGKNATSASFLDSATEIGTIMPMLLKPLAG